MRIRDCSSDVCSSDLPWPPFMTFLMMIVAWLSTDGHPLQIAVAGPQARAVPAAAPGPAGTSGSDRGQGRDRLFHFEERRTVLGEQSLAGELDRHRRRIAGHMGERSAEQTSEPQPL